MKRNTYIYNIYFFPNERERHGDLFIIYLFILGKCGMKKDRHLYICKYLINVIVSLIYSVKYDEQL